MFITIGFIILFLIIFFVLRYFIKKYNLKLDIINTVNYRLFLISIPREFTSEEDKKRGVKEFVTIFSQLLEQLSHYKKDLVLEIAKPYNEQEIKFYCAVNRKDSDLFSKMVSSLYPFSQIEPVKDYTIFSPNGIVSAGFLKLKEHFVLPFRTFKEMQEDVLATIVNAFSRTAPNEGMALQIIIHPYANYKKTFEEVIKALKEGKSIKDVIVSPSKIIADSLKNAFNPIKETEEEEKNKSKQINENLIKIIEEKSHYFLFEGNIRLLASTDSKERSEELIDHLEESFNVCNNPLGNQFEFIKLKSPRYLKNLIYNFSFRKFNFREVTYLNSVELATIFHFPHPLINNSRIHWLKARSAPPPLNLPQEGIILGISKFEDKEVEVRIKDIDRRRHVYVVGQTGTGKTTLLKSSFVQDIKDGKGGAFIDPHGDAALEILGLIPQSRKDDVIYFNPGDPEYAMGLNMLDWDNHYTFQKTFVINELLEIVDKLYDLKQTGGPLFEQYFRYSLHLLLDDKARIHTLSDIVRVFNDEDFRNELLTNTPDPMVRAFWEKQATQLKGEWALPQMSAYIVSKLTPFLANDLVRPIVNQKKTTLNFRKIMDEGKILIINLSKGVLGDVNSYLIGMLLVAKLTMAAFSRQDIAEEERKDFYLYIDEFQNVTTDSIATIFSEARKYRLNLFVGHQYLAQLKEPILKAVFGNVGTIISFRVGNEDADILGKYFAPVFSASDVMNLDNFHAYIKLLIDGQVARPFSMRVLKPVQSDAVWAHQLESLSNQKYARPRAIIEQEIRQYY
ncbi:MAG: type IV secretory system conjugative DNA transfer family protein [Minisyncoccia bacterium]